MMGGFIFLFVFSMVFLLVLMITSLFGDTWV